MNGEGWQGRPARARRVRSAARKETDRERTHEGSRYGAYREQSPITYATRIKTPTLVMSNMEDFRVPPTQAFELYRAMKDNGVETEFIGFTGRTHYSADPVNAFERARLWVDWVKRHLSGTGAVP